MDKIHSNESNYFERTLIVYRQMYETKEAFAERIGREEEKLKSTLVGGWIKNTKIHENDAEIIYVDFML